MKKLPLLTRPHNFITGESVRVISDNGQLPDGLTPNTVAFAVTTGPGVGIAKY